MDSNSESREQCVYGYLKSLCFCYWLNCFFVAMFEKRLSLDNLHIRPEEVYRQMGYGDKMPDERTAAEVKRLLTAASQIAVPRYCYMVLEGRLENDVLRMGEREFRLGHIIERQLAGATHFAVFVATAGTEYEEWRKKASIDKLGWKRTNRFSPGYCEWATDEQRMLVPLLGNPNPCRVRLNESALMWPVKSVSGIIGLGENVSYHDYACRLCQLTHCFRRR